jgi:hypothetical protein
MKYEAQHVIPVNAKVAVCSLSCTAERTAATAAAEKQQQQFERVLRLPAGQGLCRIDETPAFHLEDRHYSGSMNTGLRLSRVDTLCVDLHTRVL